MFGSERHKPRMITHGEELILTALQLVLQEIIRMNMTVATVIDKVNQLIAIEEVENETLGSVVVALTGVQADLAAAIAANDPATLQAVADKVDVAIASARAAVTAAGGTIPGEPAPVPVEPVPTDPTPAA